MPSPYKVSFKWVAGNAVFYDENGDEIFTVDGDQRLITIPGGSGLTNAGATIVVVDPDDVNIEVSGGGELQIVPASLGLTELDVAVNALLTIVAAIPIIDPTDGVTIWNNNGVLELASP